MNTLVWLQRDLRLADHAPLVHALQRSDKVVIAYIHDPSLILGEANAVWLGHSLRQLQNQIQQKGGDLLLIEGAFSQAFEQLVQTYQINQVFYHYEVGQVFQQQQTAALKACQTARIPLTPYDQAWCSPESVLSQKGGLYSVFTPFYKKLLTLMNQVALPMAEPQELNQCKLDQASPLPASLIHLMNQPWAKAMIAHWQQSESSNLAIGELAAWSRFQTFVEQALNDYPEDRDLPAVHGTSRLSVHLQFGEISMRQLLYYTQGYKTDPDVNNHALDMFIRQLAWREFGRYLLHFHPQLEQQPFQAKFAKFPWDDTPEFVSKWQEGKTGFPIIDAAMRELWHTGFMHNRTRMLVASWLTKNANQAWQVGQAWFANTLIDSDPANNTMGWQWVAGCGVDAAPYYRLFNPLLQSEKFDPQARYIKHWLPELANLDEKACHAPWKHPKALAQAGIQLGRDYPEPCLSLEQSRADHLARVALQKSYTQALQLQN